MQQRFIIFMSTLFLLSHMSSWAALDEASKFITEADIPKSTYGNYMFAGFVTGLAQHAAFTLASNDNIMLFQWNFSVIGSVIASHRIDANIRTLTQFDDRSTDWVYNELVDRHAQCSLPSFRAHFNQLKMGQQVLNPVYSPQDIYSAYNKLLIRSVKKQAFVGGYTIASVFGPLPSSIAMALLLKLT